MEQRTPRLYPSAPLEKIDLEQRKSFDTFIITATTSTSITLSLTGIGLIVIPLSTSIARGLTISNKVIYEIVMRKYNRYKNQFEKESKNYQIF